MSLSLQMQASGAGLLLSKVARSTCRVNRPSMSLAGIGKDLQDERPHRARSLVEHERGVVDLEFAG
jgi:hypothetical protein